MKVFYRAYCRFFQGVFRLVMPLLPYRKPELLSSPEKAAEILKGQGVQTVLMVTGPKVHALGLTGPMEKALEAVGIDCCIYDKTATNPTIANAEEARALYQKENCQAIIALGGGSPMDCAKAAGARIARPGRDLGQMKGLLKVGRPLPLLLAIPTTAGSGSETTLAAVIVDEKTHEKYAVNDFALIPSYALLDGELTRTLPPSVTAQTGMDALTHAVEAYIGRSTTAETRRDAEEAVRLIFQYLPRAWADGADMEARSGMLRAAFLAGCAFTRSYVGYVHALAHPLGGKYDVPHGLANAILLPKVLDHYGPAVYPKLGKLAQAAGLSGPETTAQEGAVAFLATVRNLNRAFGIPETVPELRREDIPALAALTFREANPLYPVPVLWGREKLETIYKEILAEG